MCYLWKLLFEEFVGNIESRDRQSYINTAKLYGLMNTIKIVFLSFFKRLLSRKLEHFKLDISCGHLFEINQPRCNCGFILAQSSDASIFLSLYEQVKFEKSWLSRIFENGENFERKSSEHIKLIDCAESKLNSIKITREIIASILQIGVFIHG